MALTAEQMRGRQALPVSHNGTTNYVTRDSEGNTYTKTSPTGEKRLLDPNNPEDKKLITAKDSAVHGSEVKAAQNESLAEKGAEANPPADVGTKKDDVATASTPPKADSPSSPQKPQSKTGSTPNGSWGSKDKSLWKRTYIAGQDRQALPFMFEVQENGKPTWQMVLPFNPENYKMMYAPRVNATLTQAGVFEDNIGISPPKFTIGGVFGYVGTTLMGIAKSLDKDTKTGMELYHEMETNMLYFYERFGMFQMDAKQVSAKVDPAKKPVLFFYNFCDQEFWQVQVTQFTLNRNIQRRHLYQYEIQITGLKRADKKDETDVLYKLYSAQNSRINAAKAAEADKKLGLWDSFMQKAGALVQGVQGAVGKATAVFQKVQNEVTKLKSMMNQISTAVQGFSNGLTDLVHIPLDLVQTAKQTADSIMDSVDQITGLPQEFSNDMRQIQRLLNGYVRQPEMFRQPTTGTSAPTVKDSTAAKAADQLEILSVPITEQMMLETGATGMHIPEETIFTEGIESVSLVASSQAQITDADTIATIALKTGTDWKQLVTLNGLEYPYVAKTPLDKYSPAKATGAMSQAIPAGTTAVELGNITHKQGDIISFGDGSIWAEVSGVNGTITTLSSSPISASTGEPVSIPAKTTFRIHDKILNVADTGDVLLIPGTKTTTNAIISNSEDFEDALYGTDEYLDRHGYMHASNTKDISTVSGMTNLEMQLWHRISTLRGELAELGHPEYGSLVPLFIGKTMTPVWQERILLECKMAVEADPRVERTGNCSFYNDGTAIYFGADVYPISNKDPIAVSLPIA